MTWAALLAACAPEMTAEQKGFFNLPERQRYAEFEKLPTEKQLEYFRVGMYREPPDMGLAVPIAKKGKEAVPFVTRRLQEEKSETAQADLIFLLGELSKYYPALKDDQEVLGLLKEMTARMKYPETRGRSEGYISLILNAPNPAPEKSR